MKKILVIFGVLVLSLSVYSQVAFGFRYPVGERYGNECPPSKDGNGFLTYDAVDYKVPVYHPGIDFNKLGTSGDGDYGELIFCVANGIVVDSYEDKTSTWGNIILVKHVLPDNSFVFSFYGHLKDRYVSIGDHVAEGAVIGTMGKGENNAWPAHLHFEIRKSNMASQPTSFFPVHNESASWVQDHYYEPRAFIDARNFPYTIASQYDFPNHDQQGWNVGNNDLSMPLGQNPITGYGMDNDSWFASVVGPNPGILSPQFPALMAKNTYMEFSAKVFSGANPEQVCTLWVKDERGSWNNPIKVQLDNAAYGYNNGNFKSGDYNVYRVDFSGIRASQYVVQYGDLQIRQFSIELTDGKYRPNEYWAIDWIKIYSRNGLNDQVYIASLPPTAEYLSSYSSGSSLSSGSSSGGSGSSASPPTPATPRYQYSGAWTCEGFADGAVQYSKVPINPKTQFNQGENVNCLVEIKNISVNHCVKIDIYKDSVFYWTWGGTTWNNVGGNTWGYSYAQVTNANAVPGKYEFRIYIDTGSGFQQLDKKGCQVISTQPRYTYAGAWVCDSIAPGPVQWSLMAVNTKTYFQQGSKVSLLGEYTNVYVNHRSKVDIYYNGAYSWTWGGVDWNNVGPYGWGFSYVTPSVGNCQAGDYEFRIFIDTGAGFQQTDSKTFTVFQSGPQYSYAGAWTCDSVVNGLDQYSKVPGDLNAKFVQGNTFYCLAVLRNVYVNHRIKVDIYKDSAYYWTWGNGNWNIVNGTWAYSNAIVQMQNAIPGKYEFRIFLDIGSGYQQIDSKICQVAFTGPGYTYAGSWTCDSVANGSDPNSKVAVNAKTSFTAGRNMCCLSVLKNVYVTHRIKVDIYKNGSFSWTWGNGSWNTVTGMWNYSNAIVSNSKIAAGQYQFKIYIDIGSGYKLIDTKSITVS